MSLWHKIRRKDQYPAINDIYCKWIDKLYTAMLNEDEAEYQAIQGALRSLQNWTVYATMGKDRFNPIIVDRARDMAQAAYDDRRDYDENF